MYTISWLFPNFKLAPFWNKHTKYAYLTWELITDITVIRLSNDFQEYRSWPHKATYLPSSISDWLIQFLLMMIDSCHSLFWCSDFWLNHKDGEPSYMFCVWNFPRSSSFERIWRGGAKMPIFCTWKGRSLTSQSGVTCRHPTDVSDFLTK